MNVKMPVKGQRTVFGAIDKSQNQSPTKGPQKIRPPKKRPAFFDWLDKYVFGRVEVTGTRTLGLHANSVTGDTNAYATTTNYGEGDQTFTNNGNLSVAGKKVFDIVSFQADIPDNRLADPTTQKVLLEYDRGPLKISEGDIRGSLLPDNSLTAFDRPLKGTMVEYQRGRAHVKLLYSETKGTAQTVSIQGANSLGPYFLEGGKVLPDTVEVLVDGQLMRPGTDYVVNTVTDSGTISFLTRVIPPTSTIVVTFESAAPGSSPGIISGAAANYSLGKLGQIGASIMQERGTGSNGDGTVPDLFVFAGASSTVYTLSYEPVVSTIVVELGDRLLVAGTYNGGAVTGDYAVNPAEPRQVVLNSSLAAPQDSTVYIKYHPVVPPTSVGDREVYGFDYAYRIGNKGLIQYSQATGSTINTASPTGGVARTLTGNYLLGKISLTGSVKDIPDNYVSIETAGFTRNERSYDLGAQVKSSRLTYGVSYGNSIVDDQVTSGVTTTNLNARSTIAKAFANYNAADGTTWSATQTRTAGHQVYDSRLDDSALSGTKSFGKKLRMDSGVEYQQGEGPLLNSAGATVVGSVSLVTYHVGVTAIPVTHLTLSGRASVSDTRALGESSKGDDLQFTATYRPNDIWNLYGSILNSNAGQSAALSGFSNGTGAGYTGNGFSAGPSGSGYLGAADGTLDTRNLNVDFKVSKRLSLGTHFSDNRSTGSLSSNSDVQDIGVTTQWDLGNITVVDISLDRTNSQYLTATSGSTANTTSANFNLTGNPKGKWSYQIGINTLLAGGSSAYNQNTVNYNLGLGYLLTKKQQVSATYTKGTYNGYDGQEDDQIVFRYTYSILQKLGLSLAYRIHNVTNLDPSITTGAYRSQAVDLELSYGFKT
jgi:hypothetical protein